MVMTALGAGVCSGARNAACSTIGSTGVHMRAKSVADVQLNREGTGYVIALPVPGIVTQVQTNMGATLNIDWILEARPTSDGRGRPDVGMPISSRASTAGLQKAARGDRFTIPISPRRANAGHSSMPMRARASRAFERHDFPTAAQR